MEEAPRPDFQNCSTALKRPNRHQLSPLLPTWYISRHPVTTWICCNPFAFLFLYWQVVPAPLGSDCISVPAHPSSQGCSFYTLPLSNFTAMLLISTVLVVSIMVALSAIWMPFWSRKQSVNEEGGVEKMISSCLYLRGPYDGRTENPHKLSLQTESNMEQPFTVSSLKRLAAIPDHTDVSLSPEERVRALSKLGCNITINEDITPRRYFRSGVEMERMASVYLEEGNLENAFVLYNKFITLFVEKLPCHRDYQQCAVPEKQDIMKKLKEVAFPRIDELKKALLKKYNAEYQEYMQDKNKCKAEQLKKLEQQKLIEAEKKRVAQIRQQQLATEQFQFFEDQLKKQELARDQKIKDDSVTSEQTDGSVLSSCISVHLNNTLSTTLANKSDASAGQSPPISRALKPAATLSAVQNNVTEGLRSVVLPEDLCHRFLQLADANTTHNEFTITHVIVPKQSAGPDYCDMENVEELFSVQDQHDLLTLGWIHTHPTQTAFLSSVDLHTHCSYQLMLPEAIAIVCSPKHNDTGVFRLTNAGMLEVSACKKKGFHPHTKEPRLFNICKHVIGKDVQITVLDLR